MGFDTFSARHDVHDHQRRRSGGTHLFRMGLTAKAFKTMTQRESRTNRGRIAFFPYHCNDPASPWSHISCAGPGKIKYSFFKSIVSVCSPIPTPALRFPSPTLAPLGNHQVQPLRLGRAVARYKTHSKLFLRAVAVSISANLLST